MGIPDHLTSLLRNLYAGQEAIEPHREQQTGSGLGMELIKAVYCHSPYLTYMQSTSDEMPDWMNHKLESRLIHTEQQRRHRCKEQTSRFSGRRRGWDDLRG